MRYDWYSGDIMVTTGDRTVITGDFMGHKDTPGNKTGGDGKLEIN